MQITDIIKEMFIFKTGNPDQLIYLEIGNTSVVKNKTRQVCQSGDGEWNGSEEMNDMFGRTALPAVWPPVSQTEQYNCKPYMPTYKYLQHTLIYSKLILIQPLVLSSLPINTL